MARRSGKYPTELELEILKVLWTHGPVAVRQIQDALASRRPLAYTTVMTMLTIMTGKGYVRRTRTGSNYLYEAKVKRGEASSGMLRDLIDRVFGGSATAVVQHLLETSDLDAEELKMIQQLAGRKSKEKRP
jgi:BlaI family penicillinase repressor